MENNNIKLLNTLTSEIIKDNKKSKQLKDKKLISDNKNVATNFKFTHLIDCKESVTDKKDVNDRAISSSQQLKDMFTNIYHYQDKKYLSDILSKRSLFSKHIISNGKNTDDAVKNYKHITIKTRKYRKHSTAVYSLELYRDNQLINVSDKHYSLNITIDNLLNYSRSKKLITSKNGDTVISHLWGIIKNKNGKIVFMS